MATRSAWGLDSPRGEDWRDLQACLRVDPELFWPRTEEDRQEAKRVCRGCPVRERCLAETLRNGEFAFDAVVAGHTYWELRAMRRRA